MLNNPPYQWVMEQFHLLKKWFLNVALINVMHGSILFAPDQYPTPHPPTPIPTTITTTTKGYTFFLTWQSIPSPPP